MSESEMDDPAFQQLFSAVMPDIPDNGFTLRVLERLERRHRTRDRVFLGATIAGTLAAVFGISNLPLGSIIEVFGSLGSQLGQHWMFGNGYVIFALLTTSIFAMFASTATE